MRDRDESEYTPAEYAEAEAIGHAALFGFPAPLEGSALRLAVASLAARVKARQRRVDDDLPPAA